MSQQTQPPADVEEGAGGERERFVAPSRRGLQVAVEAVDVRASSAQYACGERQLADDGLEVVSVHR